MSGASGEVEQEAQQALEEQKLALRIKSKKSQNAVLRDVSTKGTVQDFLVRVSEVTGIPRDRIVLLTGFPPRRLEYNRSAVLETLGLSNQDTIIVEEEVGEIVTAHTIDTQTVVMPPALTKSEELYKLWNIDISEFKEAGHKPWAREEWLEGVRRRSLQKTEEDNPSSPGEPESPSTSAGPGPRRKNMHIIEALNSSTMNDNSSTNSVRGSNSEFGITNPSGSTSESPILVETLTGRLGHTSNPITLDSPASSSGMILRHVVPADNSCLFSSVSFCLSGNMDEVDNSSAVHMRELIAASVESDPDNFNEAMLGRPNAEYVTWIMKSESWGGGIELSILSEFYEKEISVVDIQSLHISKFGEDKNYSQRMLLLYDGIHYDPLYMDPFDGRPIQTLFSTSEDSILDKAIQLGREAKAAHQFTDLSNFALRCGICNMLLKGQTEAQAHAKITGHANFAEIIAKSS